MLRASLVAVAVLFVGSIEASPSTGPAVGQPLIVHEWGTFTSFQATDGTSIPGINVDDEPVPQFVHRLNGFHVFRAGGLPAGWSQGAPRCHPDVTLRLETPVLYFYPSTVVRTTEPIDVEA